jgi:protein-S-isoprenylcysteine O-methyltransferase Ste14
MRTAVSPESPWIFVPPPLVFVVCFVGGAQLDRVLGLVLPDAITNAARIAGVCAAVLGLVLLVLAPAIFARTRTTIVPHGRARTLVTSGPYRFTRNPMYLGLSVVYVGAALATNHVGALPFLAIPLWLLSAKTIPYEEAMLEGAFGEEYRGYARRVRRWL